MVWVAERWPSARPAQLAHLARNMPGGNENSPEDMGRFVGVLDAIRAEFGCSCLVLHHSGHDHTERGRGHSSWPSAVDISVRLEKTGTPLEAKLTCTKMRGAAAFDARIVRLEAMYDTLVVTDAVDLHAALVQRVEEYLASNPGASQNDVCANVTGRGVAVRAAYQEVKDRCVPAWDTPDTPEQGVSQGGVSLRDTPRGTAPDLLEGMES
jgi:hypothetical protein